MIPLDPPGRESATVGRGRRQPERPRRAVWDGAGHGHWDEAGHVEGQLVQSGGMVVKNVAAWTSPKLMVGSFGTLAAIAW